MKLALDTNAYRALGDGDPKASDLFQQADLVALPIPVLAELRFGFLSGTRGRQNEAALLRFMDSPRVTVLDCDDETTHYYAEIRLQLKKQGTPIPINDVWIAALVLQHRMTLLTYDRDFERIPQLPRA